MKKVIYVHGKGGNAAEADHFGKLFADCEVVGFDYKSQSPTSFRRFLQSRGMVAKNLSLSQTA